MMAAPRLTCGLATTHGTSHSSSLSDDVLCGDDAHLHWSVRDDICSLLERTPVRALLQHNSKFLMVQSSVSLLVCIQAMVEYDFTYVLVYDPALYEIIGCLDDRFFLHLFAREGLRCLHKSCKELLDLESDATLCKVDEHMSARDAAPLMCNQSSKRLFVWSAERDVPIGYLTPSCYLGYISKHLPSCVGGLRGTFEDVISSPDRPTVSEDSTLQEVMDVLIDHDTVLLASVKGQVICVLNRSIIVQYLLSVLRGKEPVKLSTPIMVVLQHFDALPYPRPVLPEVKESQLLKDELGHLLYSRGGAVLCVECHMDYSRVVTVWDVLCHVLRSSV